MITRIEVDGFKSLRRFAIDLEPFTVLIGPNSAGKSNLLDALALLSRLASQPIAEAFRNGRGRSIDQFSRHGTEVTDSIRFAIELLEYGEFPHPTGGLKKNRDAFQSRYRYELTISRVLGRAGTEKLVARHESLRAMRREDDEWIPVHPEFSARAGYGDGGDVEFTTIIDDRSADQRVVSNPSRYPEELSILPTHTALGRPRFQDYSWVKRNLLGFRLMDSGGVNLGEPSERIDSGELAPDAANLPTVLAELPSKLAGEIRADLVSLVPGVASFETKPAGDQIELEFELSGGERMPARLMSAGTLRILALLTALRMEPRPSELGIEEPENGIYPGRLRALLELLREQTTRSHEQEAQDRLEEYRREGVPAHSVLMDQLPTQIILTTHSPVALATFRKEPLHLRFVDMVRRDGQRVTRVRTVGKPGISDRQRTTISLREIDLLLRTASIEESPEKQA